DIQAAIRHTARICATVELLKSILNDFLLLTELEAGIDVVNNALIMGVMLGEVIVEYIHMIFKKNPHIIDKHNGLAAEFMFDAHLLKSSIINLISNAIKYSGEDTFIEFSTAISEDACTVIVKDNGIGIPDEDQVNLFEPFFRAHNTGNIPGTGLGLNIVKRYISLMEGELEYWSALNKGTMVKMVFKK